MKMHKNHLRLLILLLLVLLACVGYMTVGVHFENQKLFAYAMRIRTPKLIAMLITAFAIGSASIVFQSIINNTIVTPCLLGIDKAWFAFWMSEIVACAYSLWATKKELRNKVK